MNLDKVNESLHQGEPTIYYESDTGKYYYNEPTANWIKEDVNGVKRLLRSWLYRGAKTQDELISPLDQKLVEIHRDNRVAAALVLGWRAGGLFEQGPNRIINLAGMKRFAPRPGEFRAIKHLLSQLGDSDQLDVFQVWCKKALEGPYQNRPQPGQVLFLVGGNPFARQLLQFLITQLLGGYSANPIGGLSSQRKLIDLLSAGHLLIDQTEHSLGERKDRLLYGNTLVQLANKEVYYQAVGFRPWWRISVSMDDDDSALRSLPDFNAAVLAKSIVCLCESIVFDLREKEDLQKAILDCVPAYIYYLIYDYQSHSLVAAHGQGYFNPALRLHCYSISDEGKIFDAFRRLWAGKRRVIDELEALDSLEAIPGELRHAFRRNNLTLATIFDEAVHYFPDLISVVDAQSGARRQWEFNFENEPVNPNPEQSDSVHGGS
jgi:hypothetical protein